MTPKTPKGYRRVATHENVLSTDLYWSQGAREWIVITEDRIQYPINDPSAWPNIIRLVDPEPSKAVDDGGPAFPVPMVPYRDGFIAVEDTGMSLRDWLAGQALAGLLACPTTVGDAEVFANSAYRHADAMLRARKLNDDNP